MHKRILAIGTALVMILLAVSPPGWAAPQTQAQSVITYPTDGMTVNGVVDVTGIATHVNIRYYQVRYAAGPRPTGDTQWVDFAIVEGTQVENDVLGTWDTTTIPDGQYTLALAVWGVDDGPYVFFVTNLTVNNTQPVETPTTEPPTLEPMPTAVIGPSPTPVPVEQPATPTPHPSPTSQSEATEEAATLTTGEDEQFNLPIDFSVLRAAFYAGGLITVLLFSLWGFYLLVKAIVRWFLRQRTSSPWE